MRTRTLCYNDAMSDTRTHARVPIWGILSTVSAPLGLIGITLAAIAAEAIVRKPPGVSLSVYIPNMTLVAVLLSMACLANGLLAGIVALAIRERPRWLPVTGIVTTLGLVALFIYVTSVD